MKKNELWLGSAGILLLVVLLYVPAMSGAFIWDDGLLLISNPAIKASDGLRIFWFTTQSIDYVPLTSTTFWLEWRLWGMNPTGYHVINILLHGLAAMLLWRVLRTLKLPLPWLAALLFAVHPVCASSVAWISERKNALSMVFY